MSFNIIDAVREHTNGQLLGQMSQLLGDESNKASSAIDSATPAMLSGLLNTTRTSRGADSLFSAVQEQDDNVIDNLGAMLSSGKASSVIDSGNSVFGGLLGTGGLGKLAGALSSFSGLSRGGTGSLMGMLVPVILGVLKRKVASDGLNSASLARLFSDQSDDLNQAMPAGLSNALTASGFISGSTTETHATTNLGSAAGVVSTTATMDSVSESTRSTSSKVANHIDNASARANTSLSDGANSVQARARQMGTEARSDVSSAVSGTADVARSGLRSTSTHVENASNTALNQSTELVRTGSIWTKLLAPLLILGLLAWAGYMFYLSQQDGAATGTNTDTTETTSTNTDTTETTSTESSTSSN